jgi:hypothetical protein
MYAYTAMNPSRKFENSLLIGTEKQLLDSTEIAADCTRLSSLNFAMSVILPGVRKLLRSPTPEIADSMFYHLPGFSEVLQSRFPRQFTKMLDAFILPTLYVALQSDSDLSDSAVDALAPILHQLPTGDFLKDQLSRLRHLLCGHFSPRPLCRLLSSLSALDPDFWFDDLFAMLCALSSSDDSDCRLQFPALAADLLGRLRNAEHRTHILSLVSTLTSGDAAMRAALSAHLAAMSSALDDIERAALIPPVAKALAGAGALGGVIGTLGARADAGLVADYCAELASPSRDAAVAAAFAFSAAAVALGRERWRELAGAFGAATRSPDVRVRRTLSFALASFAFAMPPRDLQRAAARMLADAPDVAEGAIANIDQIARLVPEPRVLLFALQEPDAKYESWRTRLAVSRQLRYCADVFGGDRLRDAAFALAVDPVAAVRKDAACSAASLADETCAERVRRMADDRSHVVRQAAARICRNMGQERRCECMDSVAALAKDPVPNVRVYAAEVIAHAARNEPEKSEIRALLEVMRMDEDVDVRTAAM